MRVAIVTPTYNEAENLPRLAEALFSLPLDRPHLVVVDDNSPDGTGQIAEDLKQKYPGQVSVVHRENKLGLGRAYRAGFKYVLEHTDAEAICQMDTDFSHPPEKLPEFVAAIENYDVVVGSRYIQGGNVDHNWPGWRKALSAFGSFYARTILGLPIKDATGGFKLWRRETLAGMPLERLISNGYVFQIEMSYIAHRLGFTLTEVPFYFADRERGQSKMDFRIQFEAAFRVFQVWWNYRDLSKLK